MSSFDVIRAWKDTGYRANLSAAELALLPEHPAGSLELHDAELEQIQGGDAELVADGSNYCTWITCPCVSDYYPICTF